MTEEEFMKECTEVSHEMCTILNGKPAVVVLAVCAKLYIELLAQESDKFLQLQTAQVMFDDIQKVLNPSKEYPDAPLPH